MNPVIKYIILFLLLSFLSSEAGAQVENNFKELQEISIRSKEKNKKKKKKEDKTQKNNGIGKIGNIPGIDGFIPTDNGLNIPVGKITFDLSWGDPVANPQIRSNRASNLYGAVRHNPDGSVRWHQGFDYAAPKGTSVLSVGQGVVSSVENHPGYGLCVLVTHKRFNKTYYSFYAHLSFVNVQVGDSVQLGTVLGKSGTTGNAYNLADGEEHLHFEYRINPKHGFGHQANPNAIVKTKFYSADPKNTYQSNVGVIKKGFNTLF